MVAKQIPEPGVYRFFALIDGRVAFYTIDWHGVESELRVVSDDETEDQVIADMSDTLTSIRPRRGGGGRQSGRGPLLRLI